MVTHLIFFVSGNGRKKYFLLTKLEHQSKRTSCRKKYKIEKKVRQHNREMRQTTTKKLKKDPGIPNLFPFKEKLLLKIEQVKLLKEEQKKKTIQDQKLANTESKKLELMLKNASQRGENFVEVQEEKTTEYLQKDDSKRAYYKEFKKVVEAADVILEVLDVRDPIGCRTKQIEEMILNSGTNKRIILVLNKIGIF